MQKNSLLPNLESERTQTVGKFPPRPVAKYICSQLTVCFTISDTLPLTCFSSTHTLQNNCRFLHNTQFFKEIIVNNVQTRMWANAQRDGRPAKRR